MSGAVLLLTVVGLLGCGRDSSPHKAPASTPEPTATDTTSATTVAAPPHGDVIVTCASSSREGTDEFVGYSSEDGGQVFDITIGDIGEDVLGYEGCRTPRSQFNAAYTKFVGFEKVPSNGQLPVLVDRTDPDNPTQTVFGQSAATGGFDAANHNALCSAFNARGYVLWADVDSDGQFGPAKITVYLNDDPIAHFTREAQDIPMSTCGFVIRPNGKWVLNGEGNHYAMGLPRAGASGPSSGGEAQEIGDAKLTALLPKTHEDLSAGGWYSQDRQTIYFTGNPDQADTLEQAHAGDLTIYTVDASGGEPTPLVTHAAGIVGVVSAKAYADSQ